MRILVGTTEGLFEIDGETVFDGRSVTALTASWALLDDREVWHRIDRRWEQVAELPSADGTSLLDTGEALLVGTEGARLFRLDGDELRAVTSFDDAPERDTWYTPWGGPPAVRSMTATDGEVFVNVHVGGILRSRDLQRWEQTIDIHTDVHEVNHRNGRLLAALGVSGVGISDDHGASWKVLTEGLGGTYVRAVTLTGGTLLATASSGPFATDAAVYRLLPGAHGFERRDIGVPVAGNIDTGWLVAEGSHAVVATPDGEVVRSDDEGQTWHRVATALPEPSWLALIP